MGLNATLATAGRSLEVFSTAIQVAGQNIANSSTPGHIRESLVLQSEQIVVDGKLVLGTGVRAVGVQQEIDVFLESRLHTANSDFAAATEISAIYQELQSQIGELGDDDLSTALSDFLDSVNAVVNQSELSSSRQGLIEQGERLATQITTLRSRIDELRTESAAKVDGLVAEANSLIQEIHELNPKIVKAEFAGLIASDAGALRAQRFEALNRLSEIAPIRFQERDNGHVDIFLGNDYLIVGDAVQYMQTESSVNRGVVVPAVTLTTTNSDVSTLGGELKGVVDGRDQVLGGFVDSLDTYTSSLIFEFNKIHSSGEGLKGYTSITSDSAVTSSTAALNAAGLNFTPEHGSFKVKITNSLTGVTETTEIAVNLDGITTGSTLDSLRSDLNAVSNLTASITTDGRLQLDAAANFEIKFADDSSGALAALGINTFFTGSDSGSIAVNSVVANDHEFLATGQGGGPSDSRNAQLLAAFTQNPVTALGNIGIDEYYESTISGLAQSAAAQEAVAKGLGGFRESLQSQRQQFSGVSLDEEAIKVIEFQRSFQAAARIVSTVDELFDVLLSI